MIKSNRTMDDLYPKGRSKPKHKKTGVASRKSVDPGLLIEVIFKLF